MDFGNRTEKADVLVVGAGPVGLLSALLLRRAGLSVRVIDEGWRATARSYAAALHQGTVKLLEGLGIRLNDVVGAHRVSRVSFFDQNARRISIDLARIDPEAPSLVIVPQNRLEALLEEELRRLDVPVNWSHRLARFSVGEPDTEVEVDVLERTSSGYAFATTSVEIARSYDVLARFVVGADGHASVVRRQLGIKGRSLGATVAFDVFEFQGRESEHSSPDREEMCIGFTPETANVLWPLPGGRQRFSFQIDAPESPVRDRIKSRLMLSVPGEASSQTSVGLLREYVTSRAPWFKSALGDIAWAGDVQFEPRLSDTLGRRNVWLVGDSVHQTGPIGIQSMNAGLSEAATLSRLITDQLHGQKNTAEFERFQSELREGWLLMLGATNRIRVSSRCDDFIRSLYPRILSCIPATGPHFVTFLNELGFDVEPA
ncbi:MAG: FAD-dependent monooxygenase [Polyangiaceae bacterium]